MAAIPGIREIFVAHTTGPPLTLTGAYTEDEFFDDLFRITGGQTERPGPAMIREPKEVLGWLQEQGIYFQPSLGGTLTLGRTNAFFLGGGRAMLNALYLKAESLGVGVAMKRRSRHSMLRTAFLSPQPSPVRAGPGPCAYDTGCRVRRFQVNIDWIKQYWGEAAEISWSVYPYNRGTMS